MNNNPFIHVKNEPEYSLTEGERASMRTQLEALTDTAPIYTHPVPSPWFLYIARPFPLAALVLLLMVSTGSVSFAASSALPGDVLYPVKLAVNERVELLASRNREAKAETQVRHAEERLREVEVLAARGTLTDETSEAAVLAVTGSIQDANTSATILATEGDTNAAFSIRARIRSAMNAHAELLDAQAENFTNGEHVTLTSLSRAVRATTDAVGPDEDLNDDDATIRVAARLAKESAENRLAALHNRLAKDGIPEETSSEFIAEMERLSSELTENNAVLAREEYRTAIATYKTIDTRAYRALTLLTSAQNIGDDSNQEVVVTFGGTVRPTSAVPVAAKAKSAVSMMMLATEATTTIEEDTEEEPEAPARLEFRLRDRLPNVK